MNERSWLRFNLTPMTTKARPVSLAFRRRHATATCFRVAFGKVRLAGARAAGSQEPDNRDDVHSDAISLDKRQGDLWNNTAILLRPRDNIRTRIR